MTSRIGLRYPDSVAHPTKKRVLVIDDERDVTQSLKMFLEQTGAYEVREANSGASGLAAAKMFRPDFIFLDILMPDMGGDAVAAQLKEDPALRNVHIVFLTAAVTEEDLVSRQGLIGQHTFLAKPVSPEQILNCLTKTLWS